MGHLDTPHPDSERHSALEQLVTCEASFIQDTSLGVQLYSRPLRHCIVTHAQHKQLFQNLEKLVTISEYHLSQITATLLVGKSYKPRVSKVWCTVWSQNTCNEYSKSSSSCTMLFQSPYGFLFILAFLVQYFLYSMTFRFINSFGWYFSCRWRYYVMRTVVISAGYMKHMNSCSSYLRILNSNSSSPAPCHKTQTLPYTHFSIDLFR